MNGVEKNKLQRENAETYQCCQWDQNTQFRRLTQRFHALLISRVQLRLFSYGFHGTGDVAKGANSWDDTSSPFTQQQRQDIDAPTECINHNPKPRTARSPTHLHRRVTKHHSASHVRLLIWVGNRKDDCFIAYLKTRYQLRTVFNVRYGQRLRPGNRTEHDCDCSRFQAQFTHSAEKSPRRSRNVIKTVGCIYCTRKLC
jgi:hypothetical protein